MAKLFYLLFFLTSATCILKAQSFKNAPHILALSKSSTCKPYQSIFVYDSLISRETIFLVSIDSITQNRFSEKSIRIASSIGIVELLKEFSLLEARSTTDSIKSDLSLLFLRQELDERLTLNFMDVTTVLAELDCEQERLIEIRNYLQEYNNRKIKTSTLLAIITGSIETIGGGLLAYFNPSARNLALGLSLSGGLASGYFSLRQLFVKEKIMLYHERNHLYELKLNPTESKIFPPNIWFFLTTPSGIGSDTISKRSQLLAIYNSTDFLNQTIKINGEKEPIENILFSDCGIYDDNLLSVRINMLELLKIKINLMKYDLKRLQQEIVLKSSH